MPRHLPSPRRRLLASVTLVAALATTVAIGQTTRTLPDRLTDLAFCQLSGQLSEPGGTFHSENYISNENAYQYVVPDLIARAKPGGLYLGVGPEQNFTSRRLEHVHPFAIAIRRVRLVPRIDAG